MLRSFFEFFSGGSSGASVDRTNSTKAKSADRFKFGDDSTKSGSAVSDRRVSSGLERRGSFDNLDVPSFTNSAKPNDIPRGRSLSQKSSEQPPVTLLGRKRSRSKKADKVSATMASVERLNNDEVNAFFNDYLWTGSDPVLTTTSSENTEAKLKAISEGVKVKDFASAPMRTQESSKQCQAFVPPVMEVFDARTKALHYAYARELYRRGIFDIPHSGLTVEDIDRLHTLGFISIDEKYVPGCAMLAHGAYRRTMRAAGKKTYDGQMLPTRASWTIAVGCKAPTTKEIEVHMRNSETYRKIQPAVSLQWYQFTAEHRAYVSRTWEKTRLEQCGLFGLKGAGYSDSDARKLILNPDPTFVKPGTAEIRNEVKEARRQSVSSCADEANGGHDDGGGDSGSILIESARVPQASQKIQTSASAVRSPQASQVKIQPPSSSSQSTSKTIKPLEKKPQPPVPTQPRRSARIRDKQLIEGSEAAPSLSISKAAVKPTSRIVQSQPRASTSSSASAKKSTEKDRPEKDKQTRSQIVLHFENTTVSTRERVEHTSSRSTRRHIDTEVFETGSTTSESTERNETQVRIVIQTSNSKAKRPRPRSSSGARDSDAHAHAQAPEAPPTHTSAPGPVKRLRTSSRHRDTR